MTDKEMKFVKKWSKTRTMGMTKFILLIGGGWGLFVPVVTQLFKFQDKSFSEMYFSREFAIQLSIYLIIGIFGFGLILWKVNEKKYKKVNDR